MLAAWLSCVQLLAAACDRAEDPSPEPDAAAANARALLIAMGRDDQHVREGIDVQSLGDSVRLARMAAVDSVNTARLAEIVREHGWPGKSRFGEEASHAAFLIVQHSASPEFQKSMLELLSAAAVTGEAEKSHVAMLTDRVLTNEDEPQRYGTQFRIVDGRLVAYPIEDLAGIDARRAAMGLAPMSEYMRVLRESYGDSVQLDSANVDSPSTSAERAPPSRPPPLGGGVLRAAAIQIGGGRDAGTSQRSKECSFPPHRAANVVSKVQDGTAQHGAVDTGWNGDTTRGVPSGIRTGSADCCR